MLAGFDGHTALKYQQLERHLHAYVGRLYFPVYYIEHGEQTD